MGVQASRYNRTRRRDARSGCIGSVLDYHAAEGRPALDDELLDSGGAGGRMARLIGEAAENGRATQVRVPGFGDFDFTAAEDRIHAEDRGIARHRGLAEIEFETAENGGDHASAKLLPVELALPSAE